MGRVVRPQNIFEHYEDALAPELVYIGYDRHEASIRALGPHVHTRAYEVCLIVAGTVEWWVGAEVHHVRAGQWFITRPGEVHGGIDSMMHRCELYFLQIALPRSGRVPGMEARQARALAKAFAGLRRRRFNASPAAEPAFRAMLEEHRRPGPLAAMRVRALLHELLVQVVRDHESAQDSEPAASATIASAMQWMQRRLDQEYHVRDAAAAAGLSVNHFQTRFRREVGLTPADYRARLRIAKAQNLLRTTDMPVTRIAMALGFDSSQYFATTFRRLVGLTPRSYREQWRGRATASPKAVSEGSGGRLPNK
jgi:AraC-like DNA-binding protein/mannose-6-phosphate isomerase-like protein (cupin superfamily)